jgi:hypothetical protein
LFCCCSDDGDDDDDDDDATKGSVLALALELAVIMNWRLPRSRVIATASLDFHGQEVWSHHVSRHRHRSTVDLL